MKNTIIILITLMSYCMHGQESLYMPLEFQKTYKNGVRGYDGKPGKNYWQNSSSYDIEAEIIPGSWEILGTQTITYTNYSPDSLSEVVIRLYPNHYKRGGVRANMIPNVNLTDGMQLSNLKVNGELVNLSKNTSVSNLAHATKGKTTERTITVDYNSTFLTLELSSPILPNSTTSFSMNWKTIMPSIYVNKIGAYDKESSYMGYWYPQIAVYDDIDGWDTNEYTGAQECYTDFGNFNVKIKVPKGNYVFATGDLQNAKQVFSTKELLAYKKSKSSTKTVVVLDGENKGTIKNSNTTWIYKAENIRDFGFGISNNFKWIATATKVNDRPISSNIIYDKTDESYLNDLLRIQNESIQFLSNQLPGVPYPYDSFTTFIGVPEFDGMEFPMMANNGFSRREISNNHMTFHELAHTYMPHWIGVNEVKYSWMEEGWATFFTIKFGQHLYRGTEFENYELLRTIRSYNRSAGQQGDTPLFTPSNYMVIRNMHFQQSYRKPAFMYLALEKLLGEDVFKKCLIEYMNRWAGHHPTPYDFMFTFNDVSAQNLNWFWKKWIFDYGYAEVAIKEIKDSEIILDNIGGIPVPITLKLSYKNNKIVIIEQSPIIWSSNDKRVSITIEDSDDLISVVLMSDQFPDVDASNNIIILKR